MKLLPILTYFLAYFLSSVAVAQTPNDAAPALPLPEEKFAAIVQFAQGKQEYDFKDIIAFEKVIEVPAKSYLKIITQKRCIAVLYEKTKVKTPKDRVSSWEILTGSARWICPEDKIEKITFRKTELHVQNGELLITGNQLNVLKNQVRSDNKELQKDILYVYKNDKWLQLKDQPDPYDLWNKQEKFPAPNESARLKMDKPQDPYVTRVFLNGVPLGLSGTFNHEWESKASDFEMETHGVRLGTLFPLKNKSVFVFFESIDAESDDNKDYSGPPPVGSKSIKTETLTLGVGLRHNHVNSSAFYYYLGFSRQKLFFHLHPDNFTYYDGKILYPYGLSAGGGYHKIFWSRNWISLMVGLDFKITQTLSEGKVYYYNGPWMENRDPRSALTQYSGFLYFGPVFNF